MKLVLASHVEESFPLTDNKITTTFLPVLLRTKKIGK